MAVFLTNRACSKDATSRMKSVPKSALVAIKAATQERLEKAVFAGGTKENPPKWARPLIIVSEVHSTIHLLARVSYYRIYVMKQAGDLIQFKVSFMELQIRFRRF